MSSTVNNAFVDFYTSEITSQFQQKASLLRSCVRNISGVRGSTFKISVASNKATSVTKARAADLTPSGLDTDWKTYTLGNTYASEFVEDFDELQTNLDLRAWYSGQLIQKLQRGLDSTIIAALATTSTSDLGSALPTANTLDGAGMRAIAKYFNQNAVPEDKRVLLIHSGGLDQMASDQEVTNKFYVQNQLSATGRIDSYFGFKIVRIVDESLLTTATVNGNAAHICYAWDMDQIALGIGAEPQMKVDRIGLKDLDLIQCKMLIGAGKALDAGIVPITILD